jgi:hypothetical protein
LPSVVGDYAFRVARQVGYSVHPQNRDPERSPRRANSSAISAPQRGQ